MENSKIQWTESTWNPWYGCEKVSPGCKYCYMFRDQERYGKNPKIINRGKTTFKYPLKIKEPKLIFTCSWSDWFIPEADQWRNEAWDVIKRTPQHIYQILTKRPQRIKDNLPSNFESYKNVWIGVSVESQEYVQRIDYLQDLPCKTFVSFEPLLGPIQWNSSMSKLDWCIIGGESGNNKGKHIYRAMELSWAEDLVFNSKQNNVACFMKQLGSYQSKLLGLSAKHGDDILEFPSLLQIREFPEYSSLLENGTEN